MTQCLYNEESPVLCAPSLDPQPTNFQCFHADERYLRSDDSTTANTLYLEKSALQSHRRPAAMIDDRRRRQNPKKEEDHKASGTTTITAEQDTSGTWFIAKYNTTGTQSFLPIHLLLHSSC
jgi:hypothetical protein